MNSRGRLAGLDAALPRHGHRDRQADGPAWHPPPPDRLPRSAGAVRSGALPAAGGRCDRRHHRARQAGARGRRHRALPHGAPQGRLCRRAARRGRPKAARGHGPCVVAGAAGGGGSGHRRPRSRQRPPAPDPCHRSVRNDGHAALGTADPVSRQGPVPRTHRRDRGRPGDPEAAHRAARRRHVCRWAGRRGGTARPGADGGPGGRLQGGARGARRRLRHAGGAPPNRAPHGAPGAAAIDLVQSASM